MGGSAGGSRLRRTMLVEAAGVVACAQHRADPDEWRVSSDQPFTSTWLKFSGLPPRGRVGSWRAAGP